MSKSATSTPRMRRDERRAQLIDVALDVFAEHGFAQTTMDEIAHRAAVSKPVLYQHFENKRDLYFTLIGVQLDTVRDSITSRMESVDPASDTADEQIAYHAVRGLFEFTSEPRGLYRLILDTSMENPAELEARKAQFMAEIVDFVSPFLLDNSILDTASSHFIASGIAAAVMHLAVRWAEEHAGADGPDQTIPLETAVEQTYRFVAHGAIGFDLSDNPTA